MRLRGYNEETEELDNGLKNIKGDIADLTKTAKTPGGISIYSDETTKELKSTKQLLGEIADIYDDLTDKQQAELLEKIGGKRGGQVVGSLLRNWEAVDKAMENMENSAGSADREMTKIEQGWDYKLNKLGETWVGVLQKMVDRKGFGSFFDMLQKMSDGVSALTDTFGGLSTAAAGLFGALAIKGSSPLLSYSMKTQQWGGALTPGNIKESWKLHQDKKALSGYTSIGITDEEFKRLQAYNTALSDGTPKAVAYEQNLKGLRMEVQRVGGDLATGRTTIQQVGTAMEITGKQSKIAALGMKAFSIAANMVVTFAIAAAITKLISVIDDLIKTEEEAKEASESLASELNSFNSSVNKNVSEFTKLAETYHELSSGVDDLGNNIGLTDEQFKTYNETVSKMVDMDDSIVKFWNNQGQAIIDVGKNLDETTQKYKDSLKLQAREKLKGNEETGEGSIQDIYDNMNNFDKSSSDENRKKRDQYQKLLDMANSGNESQKQLFKSLLGFNTVKDTLSLGLLSDEDIKKQYYTLSQALDEIKDKYGTLVDDVISEEAVEKDWKEIIAYIKGEIDSLNTELTSREKQFQAGLLTQFEGLDEYWEMDESSVDFVSQLIGSMDDEMRRELELMTPEQGRVWLEELSASIMDNQELISDAYQEVLKIQESDLPVDQAYDAIMKYINQIAALLHQDPEKIKKMLGFSSFFEGVIPAYDRAIALGSNGTYGSVQGAEGKGFTNSVGMKEAMADNSINTTEEINNFIEILQKANSLDEAIQRYNASLAGATEETKTFKGLWKELDKETRNKLLDMAKGGNLSAEAFEKFKKGKYAQIFKDIGIGAEEAVDKINKMVQSVEQMSSMKTGISAILSAYDEKRDAKDNRVGADTLQSLGNTLGVSKWKDKKDQKVWDKYQKTAASGTASLKKLKAAQDALATSYVNNENFLADLDEEHKDYYKDLLTEMGVTNADAVVTESLKNKYIALNREKMATVAADRELTEAEKDSLDARTKTIGQLIEEGKELGYTGSKLKLYVIETIKASKVTLATDGSIKNLRKFAEALGAMPKQARQYATLVSNLNKLQSGLVSIPDSAARQHQIDYITGQIEEIESSWTKVDIDTSGGSTPNSPSGDDHASKQDKKQKANKQYIDWIERRITRINNIISRLSSSVENIGKWIPKIARSDKDFKWIDKFTKLSDATDKKRINLTNKNLKKQFKEYKQLYKMQNEAQVEYQKKANSYVFKKTKGGKKKRVIPKSVINKIKSGKYTDKDLKYWFNQYGEKAYDAIQNYIDYYDKSQTARQNKQETAQQMRENKIQRKQNWADLYDTRKSRAEARENIAIGYKDQNKAVETQLNNLRKSYDMQIEIAKLEGDYVEAQRLKYEKEAEERELLYHQLENIKTYYDNVRSVLEHNNQDLDNALNEQEAKGLRTDLSLYARKNDNNARIIQNRQEAYDKLLADRSKVTEGSSQWYEYTAMMQEIENEISSTKVDISNNLTSIRDGIDAIYDEQRENNTRVANDYSTLATLVRGQTVNTVDKDNNYYGLTSKGKLEMSAGLVTWASASKNIGITNSQIDELQKLKDLYDSGVIDESGLVTASGKTYESIDALELKLKDLHAKNIQYMQEEYNGQQKIIDLMTEYYEGQKTYLGELIDARKTMLNQEKDMYDYAKGINEKTKNLATLQKRMAALSGDNSEEGKARRQRLQTELDQAQQDLQDTEYERWKSDQESMLDHLAEQYNDIIDKHLQDTDSLIKEGQTIVKQSSAESSRLIQGAVNEYGGKVDEDVNEIIRKLGTGDATLDSIKSAFDALPTSENLKEYLKNIASKIQDVETAINNKEYVGGKKDENGNPEESFEKDNDNNNTTKLPTPELGETQELKTDTSTHIYSNAGSKSDQSSLLVSALNQKGTKTSKKESEITSALNKKLYALTKGYSWGPRIIPNAKAAKDLYIYLGGKSKNWSDENALKKDGVLYKYLKKRFPDLGFKTGGIGRLVKANGEDGLAMVRNGEGFVMPEHVQSIQQLLNVVPDMTQLANATKNMNNQTTIETLALELPNVQDVPSFVNEFQNNKDVQRIFKIAVTDLVKNGNYSSNIYSV